VSIALDPLGVDSFDGIASLVEKSLLRQEELPDGQPWYVMLETVREFAQERLAESGENEAIERRHILYYMKLAETADQQTSGAHESAWQARIEQEHDNLRAALSSCLRRGYVEPGFRLALALWWFWLVRGHLSEGRERFGVLLARFPL
jgi:predicted ATPase